MRGILMAVVAACLANPAAGQDDRFPRIHAHLREEVAHVPNYTCLETVSRFRKDPRSPVGADHVLALLDTVRLEIVYADRKEWFGSPGAQKVGEQNPSRFVGGGMMSNGAFAGTLNNVLNAAEITYVGERAVAGRQGIRYDFRLRRALAALTITISGLQGTVGQQGSMWVEPGSLDLIRLESRAMEIPSYLPLAEAGTNVDYARTRIGGTDVLLAQQADTHMVNRNGVESFNRVDFTHCRAYAAQSEIRYDTEPGIAEPKSGPETAPPSAPSVPPFLVVEIQLAEPVTDKDIVGTPIEGRVAADVTEKKRVVIPKGSVVHGRIRRLERFRGGESFIVGLEFGELAVRGVAMPFYADLERIEKRTGMQAVMKERVVVADRSGVREKEETITLPALAGVASFFVKGPGFVLPKGFQMVWRTRGPISGFDDR